ncbi:MAG: hypothetical protein ACUX7D_00600 [Candidatus Methanodesulfokora washburnensis]|jgi:hypothetical protein
MELKLTRKESGSIRLYSVDFPEMKDFLKVYIFYSEPAFEVAAHPHIVLDEFHNMMRRSAEEIAPFIVSRVEGDPVLVHVLRAGPGYHLHDALSEALDLREVFIRTQYVLNTYMDHRAVREIKVTYQDFSQLRRGDITVIKPDTEATGGTGEKVLERIKIESEIRDCDLRKLILYGYISKEGLLRIARKASSIGFEEVMAIALIDIPHLSSNMYDMPAFGPDLSLWREKKEIRFLGSITDVEIFKKLLMEYVPGVDQPGDFSERQKLLYDGYSWRRGEVEFHLRKSEEAIMTALETGTLTEQQKKIAENEIKAIWSTLERIRRT